MLLTILGLSAVILQVGGFLPYIRDILIGKTKPERASFWIFSLLTSVSLVVQLSDKISWATALLATSLLTLLTIATLSIKYGYGSFHMRDTLSVLFAIMGVILWQLTSQPLIAVSIVILIDLSGVWLILLKVWEAPQTETLFAWAAGALAATFATIAAQSLDPVQIGFIGYSAIANWLIVILIIYRRKVLDR